MWFDGLWLIETYSMREEYYNHELNKKKTYKPYLFVDWKQIHAVADALFQVIKEQLRQQQNE